MIAPWMDICNLTSFVKVFQSYRVDLRVTIKRQFYPVLTAGALARIVPSKTSLIAFMTSKIQSFVAKSH